MKSSQAIPTLSPLKAAESVFGDSPKNVIFPMKVGADAMDWLEAIFRAIEALHDQGGGTVMIKRLASLGAYVASDMAESILGHEYETLLGRIEAAEAKEGGAE